MRLRIHTDNAPCWTLRLGVGFLIAAVLVCGPQSAAPAQAWTPCDLPGGARVCKTADSLEIGSELAEKASGAADFATDPLGYMSEKLSKAASSLFKSLGKELKR